VDSRFLISGLFAAVLILSGCGSNTELTPTLRGASVPTRMATATATLTPTQTLTPTSTMTPTTEPSPTATATVTSTATHTPSPTPDVPTVEIGNSRNLLTTGELSTENPRQRYVFVAQAGDLINLSMRSQGQRFAPVLILEDAAGNPLIQSESDPAIIENFLIPEAGTYRVLATIMGDPNAAAGFDFSFQRIEGAEFDPASNILLIPISPGGPITGTINNEKFFTSYVFTANAGDRISIEMNSLSGDLDAYLVLVNRQNRQVVAENDDNPGMTSLDAFLNGIVIPENGMYIILASRYGGETGGTTGSYSLRLIRN